MKKRSKSSELARMLLDNYDIKSTKDIQDVLKDLFGTTIKEMMEAEMDIHMGASKGDYGASRNNDNYRNGYKNKTLKSSLGEIDIDVPQDRNSTFNSTIVPKRKKDISDIEQKIINMYARGTSTRDISDTIEEIYGFDVDASFISAVTDKIIPIAEEWQNRQLESVYPVVYIDATHFSVRGDDRIVSKKAAYVVMGIDMTGRKDVLSLEIGESESSKFWLSVLNNLKKRGVKDILVLCSDRLSGIREAINASFPKTIWQACIIHLIRNTLLHVSYKYKKELADDLKTIYKSINEEEARKNLEIVKIKWDKMYKGVMDRWENNWDNIVPMFDYGIEFRKLIYTTNAIESLNSQYKRLNKGRNVFPSKESLFKSLYLATDKICKKWTQPIRNWGMIYGEIMIFFGTDRLEKNINI